MQIDACYQLGYIQDTHGLKGYVQVQLDVDNPTNYHKLESVYLDQLESKQLVPFFIQQINPQGAKLLIKFEEIDHIEQAKQIVGRRLYLPTSQLPSLSSEAYYYHDLVGAQVMDQNLGPLGYISCWYDQTPQLILGMEYQEREVLIPFNDEVVQKFDRAKQQLFVTLPAGLLDLYLSDDHEN